MLHVNTVHTYWNKYVKYRYVCFSRNLIPILELSTVLGFLFAISTVRNTKQILLQSWHTAIASLQHYCDFHVEMCMIQELSQSK